MQQTLFTEIEQVAPATLNLGDPLEAKRFVAGLPETLTAAVAEPVEGLAERLSGLYGGELAKVFARAMRQSLKTGGAYRVVVKDGEGQVLLVVTFHLRR